MAKTKKTRDYDIERVAAMRPGQRVPDVFLPENYADRVGNGDDDLSHLVELVATSRGLEPVRTTQEWPPERTAQAGVVEHTFPTTVADEPKHAANSTEDADGAQAEAAATPSKKR